MESQNYEESLKNAQNWHGFTIISHLFPLTNNQWMILVWWILDVECFNGFCSLWNRYISLSHSATVRGKRCLRPGKMSRIPEVQKDIWPWQRSATKGAICTIFDLVTAKWLGRKMVSYSFHISFIYYFQSRSSRGMFPQDCLLKDGLIYSKLSSLHLNYIK